jgi:hypothetical protein
VGFSPIYWTLVVLDVGEGIPHMSVAVCFFGWMGWVVPLSISHAWFLGIYVFVSVWFDCLLACMYTMVV